MPWAPINAKDHTSKADTKHKQTIWAHIANQVLKETGDEARAIREANAAIARMKN